VATVFGLSIEKILMLVLVGLFVLGPERLPAAAAWAGKAIRQVKDFAAGASEQLRAEIGPELDQLRQPLADLRAPLQELRALRDPRNAVMRHLFTDPQPVSTPKPVTQPVPAAPVPAAPVPAAPVPAAPVPAPARDSLASHERPPIDIDAT